MKRILSLILSVILLATVVFTVSSCSNVSASYAKKINKAAEKGEHYTYEQVKEDLGEDVADLTIRIITTNGILISIKDCDSIEDIEEKLEEGKTLKGIVVTIVAGKATKAEYREITKDDLKL